MQVTNNTTADIYFGPLHLGAGIGTQLTVDDTSATSLYLTSDDVADALNNAYNTGKIQVSGAASPFPRPTPPVRSRTRQRSSHDSAPRCHCIRPGTPGHKAPAHNRGDPRG
jgi:hypothetical protein